MNINDKTQLEVTGWERIVLDSLTCSVPANTGMTLGEICAATYIKRKRIEECLRGLSAKHQVKIDEEGRWQLAK